MLNHLDRTSLTDSWTLSHADCSLLLSGVDWPLASPFANSFFSVPLSNSLWRSLPNSGRVEIAGSGLCLVSRQTKGSSAWRTTYIVLQQQCQIKAAVSFWHFLACLLEKSRRLFLVVHIFCSSAKINISSGEYQNSRRILGYLSNILSWTFLEIHKQRIKPKLPRKYLRITKWSVAT